MTDLLKNPQHWRERANEARLIAQTTGDAEAKRLLLELVESYERLAKRAEERVRGTRK